VSIRVAIDVGGTFTDLVGYDEANGQLIVAKESTTPDEFSRGVQAALTRSKIPPARVNRYFANGSTIVINALTERKGARTALLATRGFRDVLEIQRSDRPDIYNFVYSKPKPFIPRRHSLEVSERLDAAGRVVEPLDSASLERALEACRQQDIEAIAICLFNAYANGAHERACAEVIRRRWPQVFVCTSHELTQEYREYERANTTVLNAYVQPVVARYLKNLETGLRQRGVTATLYAMASNGGAISFPQARRAPIQVVESGPVAGAIGAQAIGARLGLRHLMTLDVGGTTAKTALLHNGQMRINTDYFIERSTTFAGYPIKVPSLDIVEVGAGGGSILWRDEGGVLRVGPRSAGAMPGPSSYGRGGTDPTLTDAFLLTGALDPNYFLGGEIRLQAGRAVTAYNRMAAGLRLSPEKLAHGAIRLANAQLINTLKLISVKRGYDPRDFTLVAFGGGGPLHACALARELGMREVIIPLLPGVFSAWGMLMADLRRDFVRTSLMPVDADARTHLQRIFGELSGQAREIFEAEGYARGMRVRYFVDARYRGQEHTVKVPLAVSELGPRGMTVLRRRFDELHQASYEFRLSDPLEIVNCHLVAYARLPKPAVAELPRARTRPRPPLKGKRAVIFNGRRLRLPVYERTALGRGASVTGPAIIEEPTSTTLMHPGDRLTVDEFGNLRVEIGA
jgi:N-methylhydantoinase A